MIIGVDTLIIVYIHLFSYMIQTSKIIKKLEWKNAVITGGSSNISPASAQRFVEGVEL